MVLAFSSHWDDAPPKGGGPPDHAPGELQDPDNQRIVMGVIGDSPFLKLRGPDGKTRVRLLLSMYGKPMLLMEDETGPRASLGIDQSDTPGPQDNNWSLSFHPERALIGMYTKEVGGRKYSRGDLILNREWVKYP